MSITKPCVKEYNKKRMRRCLIADASVTHFLQKVVDSSYDDLSPQNLNLSAAILKRRASQGALLPVILHPTDQSFRCNISHFEARQQRLIPIDR